MSSITTEFARNKIIDAMIRGQAIGTPATWYIGIFNHPYTSAATSGSTTTVINDTSKSYTTNENAGGVIRFTSGANSGLARVIASNTATSVTVTSAFPAAPAATDTYIIMRELVGNGYTRTASASSLAAWAGTQGAGTTTASTGTSGKTSNNADIILPQPTGTDWLRADSVGFFDAVSAGNLWFASDLTRAKIFYTDDDAPKIRAGDLSVTILPSA